ncbi:hypothetical protein GF378_00120 [Candidatus Pacearchaeota archaeon]|nr:hypothetical protein [Candidatus Pacearchaeota archaeon]
MAKICIIEDNERDLIERYSKIARTPNDVHVILDDIILFDYGAKRDIEGAKRRVNKHLSEAGFNINNLSYDLENPPTDADVYFCDGLKGFCFNLADKLGKERVYIYSDSLRVLEQAKKEGYNLVKGVLEDMINNFKER